MICTNPIVYLPQYSYIFRKPEPLGIEMKNVACYRLGAMLHLDIQNAKEDTNTLVFQKYTGGTAACMKRLIMTKKGCGQLASNDTKFSDIWFSGLKTAEEAMDVGVDFCWPLKTSHKDFCLATLEKLMRNFPAGSYLVMKSTTRVPGSRSIMVTGYK